ncbi:MAG: RNase P subunit p30 family protein [Promethearchaeota archaeon]
MSYFESRLKANFEDIKDIKLRLKICEELGIKNVILEPKNNLNKISSDLKKKIENETNIRVYYRINLKPNSVEFFKKKIKKYNNFPDILSVESLNKEVQIHAARDSRVDILSFSDQEIMKTLTPGVVSLIKQNKSFIEFSLAPIMVKKKPIQSKNFRNLYRFTKLVRELKANFILSGNFEELFDLRHPRAMMSISYSLLDIPLREVKKIFKDNPRIILGRVQKRQSPIIFEGGLKLIKGENKND